MIDQIKLNEKADILETNLFKDISNQKNPVEFQIKINRNHFPDPVAAKALVQLMPRFNIKPGLFILQLKELMKKKLSTDESSEFSVSLSGEEEILYTDEKVISREFHTKATADTLTVTVSGIPSIPSIDGHIAESYFDHEKSAGMLNESGVINFREINRYPIVKAGQKLFYIVHEKQGRPGIAYDGRSIEVKEAVPFSLMIGEGVDKIDDIDKETGQSKGYHLDATKTGVVVIDWNENNIPVDISIQDEIKIDRVDYSVGNIGSQLTCPISANIGVICNGFKIRVNGRIEGNISEGAEIITDDDAQIGLLQNGSVLTALKNIMITSSSGSQIQSKQGVITVKNELIDSLIKAPEVLFENNNGLLTNNTIEVDRLSLKGLHYSGVNIIYFGKDLFYRKNELIQSLAELKNNILELETSRKDVMGKLQVELKKMAGLIHTFPDLAEHLKSLFLATKAMDYPAIFKEMDSIQQRNNTRPVAHTRDYFEGLEKINNKTQTFEEEKKSIKFEINSIDQMMDLMELSIDGVLRKGAVIKIFNGHPDEENQVPPDYLLESQGEQATRVHLKGSYSRQKGFEFLR